MLFNRSSSLRGIAPLVALLVATLALALPVAAAATTISPTDEQYGSGVLEGGSSGTTSSSGDTVGISELPFTGLDLVAIAAIGVGLLGAGFVVRRAAAQRDDLA